jgi:hypothetical protein
MSQNSVKVPVTGTVSGLQMAQAINLATDTLATDFSGASAPTTGSTGLTSLAGVTWHDTANNLIKMRNLADTAWITLYGLDQTKNQMNLPAVQSINGGAQAIFLNRLINGGMQIAQRGAVNCSNGSYFGGCDRYIVQTSATGVSAGQVQQAANANMASGFSQQIAGLTTTGTSTIGIKQRLESTAVADFNNKTITISGKAYQNTGASINISVGILKANALNDFTGVTQIGSYQTVSIPNNAVTPFSVSFALGATDATNGLQTDFLFSAISAVTTKNFEFGELDIRVGSIAPAFPEIVPIALELQRCQRFYEKSFDLATKPAQNAGLSTGQTYFVGGVAGATTLMLYQAFKVRKRASPTITLYNPAAANALVRNETRTADCGATTSLTGKENGFLVTANGNGSGAVGDIHGVHWTAEVEL